MIYIVVNHVGHESERETGSREGVVNYFKKTKSFFHFSEYLLRCVEMMRVERVIAKTTRDRTSQMSLVDTLFAGGRLGQVHVRILVQTFGNAFHPFLLVLGRGGRHSVKTKTLQIFLQ